MNTNRRFLMKAENKSATFVAALLLAATLSNRALGRRSGIAAFYLFALLLSLGTIEARQAWLIRTASMKLAGQLSTTALAPWTGHSMGHFQFLMRMLGSGSPRASLPVARGISSAHDPLANAG